MRYTILSDNCETGDERKEVFVFDSPPLCAGCFDLDEKDQIEFLDLVMSFSKVSKSWRKTCCTRKNMKRHERRTKEQKKRKKSKDSSF